MLKEIEKTLKSHPFLTPWFLQNYNIQTLYKDFVPYFKIPSLKLSERKYITLPDGLKLAADCWWQKDKSKHATVMILSGIEAYWSTVPHFAKGIGYKAYSFGFNVIHLKQRSEGDTFHLAKSAFNEFLENDLTVALEQFRKWDIKKIYLVGLSAGGALVLREMALKAKNVAGGVAISPPFNTFGIWNHIEKRPFYDGKLLDTYKNLTKKRLIFDNKPWDKQQMRNIKTKRQWFETYMHLWGYPEKFSSLEEYQQKTDILPLLPKIHLPTLIIHAYDDPVTPVTPFTKQDNPNLITLLTKHGGHGGFVGKKLYGDLDNHWAQNRTMEFIRLLEKN